jgi:hypothetical protein
MDLGDWQELARLRAENHYWHRCITDILEALEKPAATAESIAQAIGSSVATLNEALGRLHRRPVVHQR